MSTETKLRKPARVPPPGSWDTHFHVFDPHDRAESDPTASYAPTDAPMAALDEMHARLGIARGVMVQSTGVVPNHDRFIRQLQGNPRLMGTAVIDDRTSDDDLARLHAAGVRGARFHFCGFFKKRPDMKVFHRSIERMKELGWHVLLHVESPELFELESAIRSMPIPVIIDHIAHMKIQEGLQQPGFRKLLELQRLDHVWIKVCNSDRWSQSGPPAYADAIPFGRAVMENDTSRLIWATDWPHVMYKDPRNVGAPPPDDADLLDLFYSFADSDEALIRQVLAENPLRLYS